MVTDMFHMLTLEAKGNALYVEIESLSRNKFSLSQSQSRLITNEFRLNGGGTPNDDHSARFRKCCTNHIVEIVGT